MAWGISQKHAFFKEKIELLLHIEKKNKSKMQSEYISKMMLVNVVEGILYV